MNSNRQELKKDMTPTSKSEMSSKSNSNTTNTKKHSGLSFSKLAESNLSGGLPKSIENIGATPIHDIEKIPIKKKNFNFLKQFNSQESVQQNSPVFFAYIPQPFMYPPNSRTETPNTKHIYPQLIYPNTKTFQQDLNAKQIKNNFNSVTMGPVFIPIPCYFPYDPNPVIKKNEYKKRNNSHDVAISNAYPENNNNFTPEQYNKNMNSNWLDLIKNNQNSKTPVRNSYNLGDSNKTKKYFEESNSTKTTTSKSTIQSDWKKKDSNNRYLSDIEKSSVDDEIQKIQKELSEINKKQENCFMQKKEKKKLNK